MSQGNEYEQEQSANNDGEDEQKTRLASSLSVGSKRVAFLSPEGNQPNIFDDCDMSMPLKSRPSIRVRWKETVNAAVGNIKEEEPTSVVIPTQASELAEIEADGLTDFEAELLQQVTLAPVQQQQQQSQMRNLLEGDSVDIRVIITGMHRVGRTCLAESLTQTDKIVVNPPRDVMRSRPRFPGQAYHTAVVTPSTCCYVTFFDSPMLTAWPTDSLAEWDNFQFPFITSAHAIIIVFDLTYPESFDYVKRVKAAIITAAEQQSLIHCPPIYVVGNKADAPRAKTLPRHEDIESLVTKTWIREMEQCCDALYYCELSAATGWKVFDLLSTLVVNHLEQHLSLGESTSAAHQRQKQRMLRRAARQLDRQLRRRRQQATQQRSCLTQ